MTCAGAAEAASAARCLIQLVDPHQRHFFHSLNHELGNPITALDVKWFKLIGVDHDDGHLASISRINEPRRVHQRDSVTRSQPASGQYESGVTEWYSDGDSGRNHCALAGFEHEINAACQVETRIAFVLITRHWQIRVEKFDLKFYHRVRI